MVYETKSAQETYALAEEMGKKAQSGQIICLSGDLGVGKTVFAKGFAKGLGVKEEITSPTFTIMNVYNGRLPLYHFDVYRIADEEEMDDIGYEEFFFGTGVSLVEWPEMIRGLLPDDALWIEVEKDWEKGMDYRRITVKEGEER